MALSKFYFLPPKHILTATLIWLGRVTKKFQETRTEKQSINYYLLIKSTKMKKAKVVLPMKLAEHFAEWSFTNGVKMMLSFTTSDGFLGENITAIVAVPDEKEEAFKAEFKNYLKN